MLITQVHTIPQIREYSSYYSNHEIDILIYTILFQKRKSTTLLNCTCTNGATVQQPEHLVFINS